MGPYIVTTPAPSQIEKDCSQFDNDRVTLLLWPESRNPLDMILLPKYQPKRGVI